MVRTEEAKRLRKDYETHKIKHGFNEYRVIEPRKDGLCNTVSTVQKDNLILEEYSMIEKPKVLGNIYDSGGQAGNVFDSNRCAPCVPGFGGGGGGKEMKFIEKEIIRVGQISNDGSQYGTVVSEDGLSATLAAGTHGYANNCIATEEVDKYRIRKLTPKECFRLMNFTDEQFDKAAAVSSNTALYKAAGNSLIPNILVGIIGQMIDGKEDVYKRSVDNFGDSVDND